MDVEIKKYNARQIKLMERKIQDYLDQKIPIRYLIDDLYALIHVIQDPPKGFVRAFIKAWSDLEIPYACVVNDDGTYYFTDEDKLQINEGLTEIKKLIDAYKKNFCLICRMMSMSDGPRVKSVESSIQSFCLHGLF